MILELLVFALSTSASECDDARTLFEKLRGWNISFSRYQVPMECCYEPQFICSTTTDGQALLNPPQILELKWGSRNLTGTIDDSILKLKHLIKIDISDNKPIHFSEAINSLPSLKEIVAYDTVLSGQINQDSIKLTLVKPVSATDSADSSVPLGVIIAIPILVFLAGVAILVWQIKKRRETDQQNASIKHIDPPISSKPLRTLGSMRSSVGSYMKSVFTVSKDSQQTFVSVSQSAQLSPS